MKKPDAEYLTSYLQEKREQFSALDAIDTRMYGLFHGEYTIKPPKHIEATHFKTGYPYQFLTRVLGIFVRKPPVFRSEPTGIGGEAVATSTKVEEFLNALFPAMQAEADEDTWHQIVLDTLLYGRGASFLVPARGIYWKDYPSRNDGEDEKDYNRRSEEWKKSEPLPIAWRHVPAQCCYWDKDDYGLTEVITTEKRTARQLFSQYGRNSSIRELYNKEPSRELTFLKYANRDWIAYGTVGGDSSGPIEILKAFTHGSGQVPYVIARGQESTSKRPEHRLKSLLYHMEEPLLHLEKLLMQKSSAIAIWCWPTPRVSLKAGGYTDESGRPKTLEITPGQAITLWEGETVDFLVWQGSPPDIDEQIATVQRYLDRMGLASVMYGSTAADASSGYALNTLIQAAQSLFGPIRDHLAIAYTALGQLALRAVEHLGETVYVYKKPKGGWISLAPDDIQQYYNLHGQVEYTLPQDLAGNIMNAMNLTQGPRPLSSLYKVRTDLLGDDSPDKTENQILLEKWKEDPNVQQFYISKAIELAGMTLEAAQQAAQQPQGPLSPALAQVLGRPDLAGPMGQAPGGILGQAGMPMAPGLGMPTDIGPQVPGPQAQVTAAEQQYSPSPPRRGGRPAGAKRRPGGPKLQGLVP